MIHGEDAALKHRQRLDYSSQASGIGFLVVPCRMIDGFDFIFGLKQCHITLKLRPKCRFGSFQVAKCDGIRDPPDPILQRTFKAILVQVLVYAQEGLLAQVVGIFRGARHPIGNGPAKTMVHADKALECPGHFGKDGFDEGAIWVQINGQWLGN